MAAYSDLLSLSQTLDTILHPPILGLRIFQRNRRDQLESLREMVSFLHDFLEKSSQRTDNRVAMESLESKISNAAYRAECLIAFLMPRQQIDLGATWVSLFLVVMNVVIFVLVHGLLQFGVKYIMPVAFPDVIFDAVQILVLVAVVKFVSVPTGNAIRLIFKSEAESEASGTAEYVRLHSDSETKDLHQVIMKFESIKKEVIKIKDAYGPGDLKPIKNPSRSSLSRRNSDRSVKNVVVGFESELDDMRTRLIVDYSKLETVSVVGMGGIGKTTLAREVYDDSCIVAHFDTRAWVTVSQDYSLRQVFLGLLDSAKLLTEEMSQNNDGKLLDYLYKHLIGKRYLIVMDDIWDTEIWDAVKRSFPEDKNGSRVLLTTRVSEVAAYAGSSTSIHQMHFMNQYDSWKLLCKKVFAEKDCPHELEDIGKEIAENCHGLPLALAVIGGLLSKTSKRKEDWRSFADNLSSVVSKDDEECMEILALSYNHLPHRLRSCFLYMGAFPEDHEIPVLKLFRLWAAEGFLKPNKSKSLELLAEEYLVDLIERNLILVSKRSSNGKIKTCSIHDLVRNLCLRIAQREKFLHVVKCSDDVLQEGIKTRRRLSFHPSILNINPNIVDSTKLHDSGARSLLCTGVHYSYPSRVNLRYNLLRVLDIIIIRLFQFPDEITALVNLRYLAFTLNSALSPSISNLRNLETIIHFNWTYGQYPLIPVEILMMPKLRHLCVTPSFFPDPHFMQVLKRDSFLVENLQTLSDVKNLRCDNGILKRMTNLKKLGIAYDVSASQKWSQYQLDALAYLHELEKLKLYIEHPSYASEIVYPPTLGFPQKLKELSLSGCGISWPSLTIIGALPNLEVLKLRRNACHGAEWEPVEGEFSRLKLLLLEKIDLVEWKANNTHFPCLRHLIIRSCYRLKMIPTEIGDIPTLKMIELVDCHHLAVTSVHELLEEQQNVGNEDLKVHIDPRPRFDNKFYSRVLH